MRVGGISELIDRTGMQSDARFTSVAINTLPEQPGPVSVLCVLESQHQGD